MKGAASSELSDRVIWRFVAGCSHQGFYEAKKNRHEAGFDPDAEEGLLRQRNLAVGAELVVIEDLFGG